MVLPAVAAAVVVAVLGHLGTSPRGFAKILWIVWLFAAGSAVALVLERAGRRLLPLAVLLQLSLAFPDHAPSRFAMARTAGNVRRLHERIADAKMRGVDDDPARAARQILELVAALSAHDRKTRGHSERVRAYADMIASELALDEDDRDRLRWAALLHDIGKLHVPGRILNKPGKPDAAEWERLAAHPAEGAALAAPLLPWLGSWAGTIEQHHERFDGNGYPAGLAGDEIGLGARVVAVADSFEVMTAARAYKKPMTVTAARREMARCAGSQFDPSIVRLFLNISIGKLWWTVGPTSWVAVVPVLGWLERSGEQIAIAFKTAAVVGALGLASSVQSAAALGARPSPPTPASAPGGPTATSAPAVAQTGATPDGDRSDETGSGGPTGSTDDRGDPDPSASPTDGPSQGGDGGAGPVDTVTDTVSDTVDTVDTVSDTISDTMDTVSDTADGVSDTVDQATGGATSPATDVVDQTVQKAKDTIDPTLGHLGL